MFTLGIDFGTNSVRALVVRCSDGMELGSAVVNYPTGHQGVLLEPDAALGGPIPNGDYRCRVIKLGSQSPGMLNYVAYPAFACRVSQSAGVQSFAKLTGSQRPVGLIFPNDALRQVFLGTMVLGDEVRAMVYGNDPDRDIVAFVERIGPQRWRMLIPRPAFESRTDVIELVPAN